eukprot:TRINITY_DN64428_c0_g3_i2.p1 TRINITY_DN64428_c0_g3~~TRINITY_DN64428_c0_g3_i2.p1  ORF type:complete len:466 (+),score=50.92 TRINITY_DN64428_c0_g3_i2:139-1398(+)
MTAFQFPCVEFFSSHKEGCLRVAAMYALALFGAKDNTSTFAFQYLAEEGKVLGCPLESLLAAAFFEEGLHGQFYHVCNNTHLFENVSETVRAPLPSQFDSGKRHDTVNCAQWLRREDNGAELVQAAEKGQALERSEIVEYDWGSALKIGDDGEPAVPAREMLDRSIDMTYFAARYGWTQDLPTLDVDIPLDWSSKLHDEDAEDGCGYEMSDLSPGYQYTYSCLGSSDYHNDTSILDLVDTKQQDTDNEDEVEETTSEESTTNLKAGPHFAQFYRTCGTMRVDVSYCPNCTFIGERFNNLIMDFDKHSIKLVPMESCECECTVEELITQLRPGRNMYGYVSRVDTCRTTAADILESSFTEAFCIDLVDSVPSKPFNHAAATSYHAVDKVWYLGYKVCAHAHLFVCNNGTVFVKYDCTAAF